MNKFPCNKLFRTSYTIYIFFCLYSLIPSNCCFFLLTHADRHIYTDTGTHNLRKKYDNFSLLFFHLILTLFLHRSVLLSLQFFLKEIPLFFYSHNEFATLIFTFLIFLFSLYIFLFYFIFFFAHTTTEWKFVSFLLSLLFLPQRWLYVNENDLFFSCCFLLFQMFLNL